MSDKPPLGQDPPNPLGVTSVWFFSLSSLVVSSPSFFSLPQTPSRQAQKTPEGGRGKGGCPCLLPYYTSFSRGWAGFLEAFGWTRVVRQTTLGPDTTSVFIVLSEFKLDGCASFSRSWSVLGGTLSCPPVVSDEPKLGPDTSGVLVHPATSCSARRTV